MVNLFEDVLFTGVDAFTDSVVQRENPDMSPRNSRMTRSSREMKEVFANKNT